MYVLNNNGRCEAFTKYELAREAFFKQAKELVIKAKNDAIDETDMFTYRHDNKFDKDSRHLYIKIDYTAHTTLEDNLFEYSVTKTIELDPVPVDGKWW